MTWALFWRLLRLIYLVRVPLITLFGLVVLGPFAHGNALLDNLFDLSASGWDVFQVSLGAFLLAYAALTTLNLTLWYGDARFGDSAEFPLTQKHPLIAFILGTLAAAIFVGFAVARTEQRNWMVNGLIGLAGFFVAVALVLLSKIVQLALTDPSSTRHPPPFLVFPAYLIPSLEERFDALYCWHSHRATRLKERFNRFNQWHLEILRYSGQGYLVDIDAEKGALKLQSGHVFALSLSIIAALIYIFTGIGKSNITAAKAAVPALAFVLLFANLLCWVLAALTFFFDRYRFPLLWTLAILVLITGTAPESDHFFPVETRGVDRGLALTPSAYLKQRIAKAQSDGKVNLVLIATPGGGIQAAAWTAQVLACLEQKYPNFRNSVALISSVSGGSLGSLLYAATYHPWLSPANLAGQARESAIDEVAWGLTQPDVFRALAPWFQKRTLDRGWALEEKWIAVNHLGPRRLSTGEKMLSWIGIKPASEPGYPGGDILLSEWARLGSKMPALVFNSMIVERGQHVVFSTTAYPPKGDTRGVINFYDLYPAHGASFDIRVATAARLSASFPYVAPASRPDLDAPYTDGLHIVDGGYYDNYGIDALVGWLRDALESDQNVQNAVKDIFVLQIRHFNPANGMSAGSKPGWLYELNAPISGLLSMWNSAPLNRDRNEIEEFRQIFEASGRNMWSSVITYQTVDDKSRADRDPDVCRQPPLSWKLSDRQKQCIEHVWKRISESPGVECVGDYLNRAPGERPTAECRSLQ